MAHGNKERKDSYIPIPEKAEFDTPSGQTIASKDVQEYVQKSPLVSYGRDLAEGKHNLEHYKKYGTLNPHDPFKGRSVNLDLVKRFQAQNDQTQKNFDKAYDKEYDNYLKDDREGNLNDPDEFDAGVHNAIRNAIIGTNQNYAKHVFVGDKVDDDGNITLWRPH